MSQSASWTPAAAATSIEREHWDTAESVVVAGVTVLVAMRVNVAHLVSVGNVAATCLAPAWLPVLRRYRGAVPVMGLGILAAMSGLALTVLAAPQHETGLGTMLDNTAVLIGLLTSFGFLLWARERLGGHQVVTLFGVGALLGVSSGDPLYATGPWKFGFSTGVTLVLLGLAGLFRSRRLELVMLLVLVVVSTATDSRSALGVLLLATALVVWQLRPAARGVGSAVRGVLGLALGAAATYAVGRAVILHGVLGVQTRSRSLQQIHESGSLLLGGRPELAAAAALARDRIWGFGSGTHISHHELLVAKSGLAAIGYDPNNGYVERYMFGTSYELHSVLGDLWSRFGLVGLLLGVVLTVLVLQRSAHAVTAGVASAAVLYLAARTLWNLAFSPWYTSAGLVALTVALVVVGREPAP